MRALVALVLGVAAGAAQGLGQPPAVVGAGVVLSAVYWSIWRQEGLDAPTRIGRHRD